MVGSKQVYDPEWYKPRSPFWLRRSLLQNGSPGYAIDKDKFYHLNSDNDLNDFSEKEIQFQPRYDFEVCRWKLISDQAMEKLPARYQNLI
jgi:hypothetical protein